MDLQAKAIYPDMRGKTFVVTGASSGMGRTLSLQLAAQGANVGLLDLSPSDAVAAEIAALKSGASGLPVRVNVQDAADVEAAFKAVFDKFGRLDGAANLAGYLGNQKLGEKGNALEWLPDSQWDKIVRTNLDGVKNCLRAAFKLMKAPGSIVNAASIAGQGPSPWNSPYGVSKWGVIGLTKSAAKEVGSKNIRVNAVAPGMVDTALLEALGRDTMINFTANTVALGRVANPQEVSRVMMFLLSDDAAYITGSVVNVDGGY